MSVSSHLSTALGATEFASFEANSLFRQLGTQLAGTNVRSPGVAVASTGFSTSSIVVNAPGITSSSVVVITGYNALPDPATTWTVSNINPTAQTFTITVSGGVGQPFNWIVLG